MFKCYDCGYEFDEPETWTERHGEAFSGCPRCNGSFDEAKHCDNCGEYFLESERNDVCQDCIDDLKERYEKVLNANFTESEIDILNLVL